MCSCGASYNYFIAFDVRCIPVENLYVHQLRPWADTSSRIMPICCRIVRSQLHTSCTVFKGHQLGSCTRLDSLGNPAASLARRL